jgi:hypothetical protein
MGKYFFSKKIIRLFGKKQSASNAEIIAIFFLILGGVLRDCFFFSCVCDFSAIDFCRFKLTIFALAAKL